MARFRGNRHYITIFGKRLPTWVVAIEAIFIIGALILAPFALLARPSAEPAAPGATPGVNFGTPIPTPTRTAGTRPPTPTPSGGAISTFPTRTPPTQGTPTGGGSGTTPPPILGSDGMAIQQWRWDQDGERIRIAGTVTNLQEVTDGPVEVHVALINCLLGEEVHSNWENSNPQTIPPGGTAAFDVSISAGLLGTIQPWDAVQFKVQTWKGEAGSSTFGCTGGKPAAGRAHSWANADELSGGLGTLPTPLPTISLLLTPTPPPAVSGSPTATPTPFSFSPTPTPTALPPAPTAPPATATPTPTVTPTPTRTPTPTPTPTPFPDGVHVIQWQWEQDSNNAIIVSGFARNFGNTAEGPVEVHATLIHCASGEARYTAWEMASPQSIDPGQSAFFQIAVKPQLLAPWEEWDAVRITLQTFSGILSQASTNCAAGKPPESEPQTF